MSISLDITFIIQLINFLISLFIINALIIKPIRANMAHRKAIIDADNKETANFTSRIESQTALYDERLAKVRSDIAKEREMAKASADETVSATLNNANAVARGIRQESMQKVQEESKVAMNDLQSKVPSYTQEALAKILA